ncbi:ferredoxin--nitrite reductase [Nodularia spumigena]|jgi:ferredoxin-nitrite reductase|uniref:Ferredoxin--nitrite reductase n=1 Tax=Nodularia spumigena UHCC 0060 TaxID=3110300 RepID=A0ABU5USC5_NODSP|nr:ferredoxin--nitrite reductase [Nodularia spumigena]AHJ28768.1 Ferredoxin--nitrite reductase [Nodularia spumigena CCY9414]EAW45499.1 nitrite reductase [Nodularia spumigena CCY9414]MEA5525039.1 ferredoxin--nitrite reductase [Nodularia spumigena UHCC 0143]MEA5555168.1 ferredoxin--nitrite reductase [Nodularia spumigena CH309]MEA5609156.1 ferredoxin--nitrite reductase [Nodularia spumigena UHCC 0060]
MTDTVTTTKTNLNKFEKLKAEKDGLAVKEEIAKFASLGWEAMDVNDRDHRLKWMGVFFRPVTPGKFMMRMRIPNGVLTSHQLRVLASVLQRYGDDGSADITTRQNMQLRGIRLEDLPDIFEKLHSVGLTSIQSGMDNVRNITGNPVAGLDADELFDTRELVQQVQDMLTNKGEGNPEFSNLPRKFNIAIAGGRDNSVHAEINDLAFVPAFQEGSGEWGVGSGEWGVGSGEKPEASVFGFNILVGGFFSAKRCEAAIPLNAWVSPEDVVAVCRAVLEVYRDNGLRANRLKSRLMWLLDEWGVEKFRAEVETRLGKALLPATPKDEIDWEKRDHIGVYKQKQAGLNYVGLNIPVGRLYAQDMFEIASLAEVYGSGEVRLTVEQNIIIPNIPDSRLATFLTEALLEKFAINPDMLTRSLVSCTGAQFCNFALIETKNQALEMAQALQAELTLTRAVRIHWTGCPNSCGQPQVADIGLMGTKARKNGKPVEGVDIYMGGTVGKDAHLGNCVQKGIPCEDLQPVLRDLLIQHFGAELNNS